MTNEVVLSRVDGDVAVVTLNRPEAKNALNLELRTELDAALRRCDTDPSVLVVILTGAGGSFCSGRDLKAAKDGEPMYSSRQQAQNHFTRTSIAKPVIAAVEGFALAGGLELALACDLIVAADDAVFGLPEVRRNLVAVGGGLIRMPVRIPYHRAMELALTGEKISASQMHQWGVVSSIAQPGEALDDAMVLARTIAANGPSAVRATKEIVRRSNSWATEADAFDAQFTIAEPALSSPDRHEGIAAFLEKRPARWTDR